MESSADGEHVVAAFSDLEVFEGLGFECEYGRSCHVRFLLERVNKRGSASLHSLDDGKVGLATDRRLRGRSVKETEGVPTASKWLTGRSRQHDVKPSGPTAWRGEMCRPGTSVGHSTEQRPYTAGGTDELAPSEGGD